MKKTRFIALTMVVALMLMGAGYAAWQVNLQVDTVVNTNDFDIEFSHGSDEIYYEKWSTNEEGQHKWEGMITDPKLIKRFQLNKEAHGKDEMTKTKQGKLKTMLIPYRFDNVFPGLKTSNTVFVRNVGSMDAVIENVEIYIEANEGQELSKFINKDMSIRVDFVTSDLPGGNYDKPMLDHYSINKDRTLGIGKIDKINQKLEKLYEGRILKNNQEFGLTLEHYLDLRTEECRDEGFTTYLKIDLIQPSLSDFSNLKPLKGTKTIQE